MANLLAELVSQSNSGALRVIDLTQPLSPETPLHPYPREYASEEEARRAYKNCCLPGNPETDPDPSSE